MKTLVVGTDEASRNILRTQLRNLGHLFFETNNVRTAWELFRRERPAIVITDLNTHEMSWFCHEIRSLDYWRMTFIIVLAHQGSNTLLQAIHSGADDFLTKPYHIEELKTRVAIVQRILNLRREVLQLRGLLPVCSHCNSIVDEKNEWHPIESYISIHSEKEFSRDLCPDCWEEYLMTELDEVDLMQS